MRFCMGKHAENEVELESLAALSALGFDALVDARSPAEFAEDHVPGALNLPVLSNAERAEVGTLYVRESRFLARRVGAARVSRNIADHLEGPLAEMGGGWRPLVYCWRGGQRSNSFATVLRQVGWRAAVLKGGYKAYRRLVVRALYDAPIAPEVILIDGGTGTAKTALLAGIAAAGGQVLDLEGMANHRGSLFGLRGEQPSQKAFESRLAMGLAGLDPARPVFVEAESSKIGARILPPSLWKAMIAAPVITVSAPVSARAAYLSEAYADLTADLDKLLETLENLTRYHGHEQVGRWAEMAREGAFAPLAAELVTQHYDPRYARTSQRDAPPLARFDLPDLSPETLAQTAAEITRRFAN